MERSNFPARDPGGFEVFVPLVPVIFLLLALPLLVLIPGVFHLLGIAVLLTALRWGHKSSAPASKASALAAAVVGLGMLLVPHWLPPLN